MVPVEQAVNIARTLRRNEIAARPVSTGTTSLLYFDRNDPYFIADIGSLPWFLRWLEYARRALRDGTRSRADARDRYIHPTAMRILAIEPGQPVDGQVARQLLR